VRNKLLASFSNEELTLEINLRAGDKAPTGNKNDAGKTRWDLMNFEFLDEMAQVLTKGAEQYGIRNYLLLETERVAASLLRHIKAIRCGERRASDTQLTHLAHAATNLMILFEMFQRDDKLAVEHQMSLICLDELELTSEMVVSPVEEIETSTSVAT